MNKEKEKLRRTSLSCLWGVVFVLLCCSGCGERDTRVKIESGNPPRFILTGRAALEYLEVTGPDLKNDPANRQGKGNYLGLTKVYWKLVPRATALNQSIDMLEPITYGTVPPSYVQVYPEHGEPPPLIEGDLYNLRLSATNAHGVNMFFAIRDGKIIAEGQ